MEQFKRMEEERDHLEALNVQLQDETTHQVSQYILYTLSVL